MARVVVVQLWMVTILTDSSAADAATTLQALCSPGCSVTLGQQAVGRAMAEVAEVAEEVPTPLSPPPPTPTPALISIPYPQAPYHLHHHWNRLFFLNRHLLVTSLLA